MFDWLRTNHELCITAMATASAAHDKKAERFARLAERFAFRACMNAMSGYDRDVKAALKIAKDNLTKCADILSSHYNFPRSILLENFKIEDKKENG